MVSGVLYRLLSAGGVVVLTALSVFVSNLTTVQNLTTSAIPIFNRLTSTVLSGPNLWLAALVSTAVVLASLAPMFKPRPRRLLDTALLVQQRVVVAGFALAAIGYFDYTYRLPRSTLILSMGLLLLVLPLWFVAIRRAPNAADERAVIIGDDYSQIEDILQETDANILGYVSPPSPYDVDEQVGEARVLSTDGGTGVDVESVPHLGGLSRLDDLLVRYDVDTAYLALRLSDRAEFFGALKVCSDHGVRAKAHRNHVDSVLFDSDENTTIVDVDLTPWDWQEYAVKRLFDVAFAGTALFVLSPVIVLISVAIKATSPGPIFYSQKRTAEFGGDFEVYKFRSMIPDAEAETGAKLSEEDAGGVDPRVTSVGRVLRKTHLDEIPQLWSILVGDMSVVGPRPERPELDADIQEEVSEWQKRWFVKPGLTGLAQINDASSTRPEEKIRYDLAYIRQQSFWFDVKIVIRQLWGVGVDVVELVRDGSDD
ncbi:exopolysaccharide biosynthesis polyprenyl glycosylphosphotransferase [Halogranum gelatinilyticum]|uniref:Exopolysaccharide biosynthesis polyprenyl glycosylphosphotransferase n=1 Tax=Halogranum gelatinilyticum TaxID=660521 RepID=A0A1G9X4Z0_9EURY|nr:sugar transferase [Halogranum gelatinilyticum]SDM91757.1 exopolysaccharide biosynthesis polyprenyl glycosylphosphotransferase [Halogranum gelatinilyticum]